MREFSISPKEMISSLWRNRSLVRTMIKRDVIGRYRGSVVGIAWSFFNPLLMLVIYTFVFSVVFKARWGLNVDETKLDFAIILFVGLIVHGFFAECVNRSPSLIVANVNYVKKVIFPLEVLPWVALGSALFHSAVSLLVLLLTQLFVKHHLPWTVLLFPFTFLPLLIATMGFSWFLSALGVYVRDISQLTGIFTTVLLFVSAVFYPIHALPMPYQSWLKLNPLVFIIEQGRKTLVYGQAPDLLQWFSLFAGGTFFAWVGFVWFQKTRKGFADVL